jgi:hypothetical protein
MCYAYRTKPPLATPSVTQQYKAKKYARRKTNKYAHTYIHTHTYIYTYISADLARQQETAGRLQADPLPEHVPRACNLAANDLHKRGAVSKRPQRRHARKSVPARKRRVTARNHAIHALLSEPIALRFEHAAIRNCPVTSKFAAKRQRRRVGVAVVHLRRRRENAAVCPGPVHPVLRGQNRVCAQGCVKIVEVLDLSTRHGVLGDTRRPHGTDMWERCADLGVFVAADCQRRLAFAAHALLFVVLCTAQSVADVRGTFGCCMLACMHVCVCVCESVHMHVRVSVCTYMYVCWHVCMYVCMYLCVYGFQARFRSKSCRLKNTQRLHAIYTNTTELARRAERGRVCARMHTFTLGGFSRIYNHSASCCRASCNFDHEHTVVIKRNVASVVHCHQVMPLAQLRLAGLELHIFEASKFLLCVRCKTVSVRCAR